MNYKLLALMFISFLVQARTPTVKGAHHFDINCEVTVEDGIVHIGTPSVTLDGKVVECSCGKRATSIAIEKGKVVGKCIDHERYVSVNPEHPDNWCVTCGSITKSSNIADKK